MKFNLAHSRAFMGNNLSVEVTCDGDDQIRSVNVDLDGWSIEAVDLDAGTSEYKREFSGVGDAASGTDHVLTVSVMDQNLNPHSSTARWTD